MRENEVRRRWFFILYSAGCQLLLYQCQGGKGHSFKTLMKKNLLSQVFTRVSLFFFPSVLMRKPMGTGVAQRCGASFFASAISAIGSRDNGPDRVLKAFLLPFDSNDTDIAHTRETSFLWISRCDCCDGASTRKVILPNTKMKWQISRQSRRNNSR